MREYKRKTTSVSLINYHSVWCPKYRRQVLGGSVKIRLETPIGQVAAELDCKILALEVMADHVHLFLSCLPILAPCQIVFRVKGRSSRKLRQEFSHLRRLLSLWFLLCRPGRKRPADTIRHFIGMQNQRA